MAYEPWKSRPGGGTPSDFGTKNGPNFDLGCSCGSWAVFVASWERLGGVLGPFGAALGSQLGSQHGANLGKKSIQKSIIFGMPLGIYFWMDFCGFWVPKWRQVGTKMGSKIVVYLEGRFFKIRALAAARAVPRGHPIGRSDGDPPWPWLQKWNPSWDASWHRFFIDFDGFWEASWKAKWTKNRFKKAWEKPWKKKSIFQCLGGGVSPRACHPHGSMFRPPKTLKSKVQVQVQVQVQVHVQVQVQVQGQLAKITHTRRRAERGGGSNVRCFIFDVFLPHVIEGLFNFRRRGWRWVWLEFATQDPPPENGLMFLYSYPPPGFLPKNIAFLPKKDPTNKKLWYKIESNI